MVLWVVLYSIFRVELNECQIDHRLESTFMYPTGIRVEDRKNASLRVHRLRGPAKMMVA
jgi:hypothetical protein